MSAHHFHRKRRNGYAMTPGAMYEHVVLGGDPPELKPPPPLRNDPQMKWAHLAVIGAGIYALGMVVFESAWGAS